MNQQLKSMAAVRKAGRNAVHFREHILDMLVDFAGRKIDHFCEQILDMLIDFEVWGGAKPGHCCPYLRTLLEYMSNPPKQHWRGV